MSAELNIETLRENLPKHLTEIVRKENLHLDQRGMDPSFLFGLQPPKHYKRDTLAYCLREMRLRGQNFLAANNPLICPAPMGGHVAMYVLDRHHVARVFGQYRREQSSTHDGISPHEQKLPSELVNFADLAQAVYDHTHVLPEELLCLLADESANVIGEFQQINRNPYKNLSPQMLPLAEIGITECASSPEEVYNALLSYLPMAMTLPYERVTQSR